MGISFAISLGVAFVCVIFFILDFEKITSASISATLYFVNAPNSAAILLKASNSMNFSKILNEIKASGTVSPGAFLRHLAGFLHNVENSGTLAGDMLYYDGLVLSRQKGRGKRKDLL